MQEIRGGRSKMTWKSFWIIIILGLWFIGGTIIYFNVNEKPINNISKDYRNYLEQEACYTGCRIMTEIKEINLSYETIIPDHHACTEECRNHYLIVEGSEPK